MARQARPGQFLHLRCGPGYDPLLRRPLSIHDVDRHAGTVAVFFRKSGQGTALLAGLQPGAVVSVLGPLGRGFQLQDQPAVIVGGGIGAAPLYFLAAELGEQGRSPIVLLGAANAQSLVRPDKFREVARELRLATDNGSAGHRGLVTELMADELSHRPDVAVYACGPEPMLARVATLAREYGSFCQVSLEARMGCGVGACLGCACRGAGENSGYPKVCVDGPVFMAAEVEL